MVSGRCDICGKLSVIYRCIFCGSNVCSSHYNAKRSICVRCANIPSVGNCEICGTKVLLQPCLKCNKRVCYKCFLPREGICLECEAKIFRESKEKAEEKRKKDKEKPVCDICGKPLELYTCLFCKRTVCSSHFDFKQMLCNKCSSIPALGTCNLCGEKLLLRTCAVCNKKACANCFVASRHMCKDCSEKYFRK